MKKHWKERSHEKSLHVVLRRPIQRERTYVFNETLIKMDLPVIKQQTN